ncbi:hypothetical protein A0H81_13813 [Grifola frondosa]|uniref:Uncharacterized protein n=1 Tax=Grifola frondosa TaxID=5627 RepID=A0A1C7LQW6_GRIFR|nr:hypothetical protein A0H81_13813 [Grifola frondosa]
MSFSRAAIVCIQAALYQLASTPPNKTPAKGRYATDEVFFSKIAPLVFRVFSCSLYYFIGKAGSSIASFLQSGESPVREFSASAVERTGEGVLATFFHRLSHIGAVMLRPAHGMQQPLIWLCTLADVLLILTQQTIIPLSSSAISTIRSTICPSPSTQPVSATVAIHTTSFLLIGALLVLSGSLLRLTCYRTLGVSSLLISQYSPHIALSCLGPTQ